MRLHKEGRQIILTSGIVLAGLVILLGFFAPPVATATITLIGVVLMVLILNFFRDPERIVTMPNNKLVLAPADGKVVVVERTKEQEFFKEERIQLSIFMSPLNVHVNRNPISGEVVYAKHHKGKFLKAWNPKSSLENERTTVVIKGDTGTVLLRQIAGAVARRIVNYSKVGEEVMQGSEMGFIKFGSRVDVFLPQDAKVNVNVGDVCVGNATILAELN